MTPSAKYSLTTKQKAEYSINELVESYKFIWDKILESQVDDVDQFMDNDGFEVVHRELKPTAGNVFDYEIIAYRDNN